MKAIVIGASGQVGKSLLARLERDGWEVLGTYRSRRKPGLMELDIRSRSAVEDLLLRVKPDIVFLPAALADVDYCETHRDEARAVNMVGPIHASEAISRARSKLVFFSTDYVFDGQNGPYGETDAARPVNFYGQTKLEAEEYIRRESPSSLIVRTAWVFGYDPASVNFAMQVCRRLEAGSPVVAAGDQWGTPTFVDDLVEATLDLVRRGAEGTFHVAGRDFLSRHEFAEKLACALGFDPKLVRSVPTSALSQKALRPVKGGLRTEKLSRTLGRGPMALDEAIGRLRSQWHTR